VPLSPQGPPPPCPQPVERARQIVPLLEAEADEIERGRRLTPAVLDALHDARLFRLLLPRALGGGEVDPVTFVHVIEAIARADASTAWCLCQASGCSMSAAYLAEPVAWDVFGRDERAVLAWGPGPARAVAVEGGYRVTGTWSFGSGMRHATWLGGYCPIFEDDGTPRRRRDGAQEGRTMLFPAPSATVTDTWHVIGLRGTASDTFSVTELFVPRELAVARDDAAERRQPGPLYCFPLGSLYASGFAGVALGIARSVFEAFVELATTKSPRGARSAVRESAVVQLRAGQAEARLGSARLYLLDALDETWRSVLATGALALERRVLIRLAATHAIHQARDVVEALYQAAGSTAIFATGAFERRFRDIHAVTQQLQGRESHFETAGQHILGLDPDTTWL
jgi:alkylation response protein AidB-like acyl-CoA dehydrogenase